MSETLLSPDQRASQWDEAKVKSWEFLRTYYDMQVRNGVKGSEAIEQATKLSNQYKGIEQAL